MKTHKASAKRFRVTGRGKIVRRRAWKQHLLSKKTTKRKLRLSKMGHIIKNLSTQRAKSLLEIPSPHRIIISGTPIQIQINLKDFQKDIVQATEAFTTIGIKHIETGMKFSEDCCKYGSENINDGVLAKAASLYGGALVHVEKEHEELNSVLSSQVLEPLRALSTGAPLEDARHLAQRYSRMRHEAETQTAEVSRRQLRLREAPIPENTAKLQLSESKMRELKANMAVLGKEAAAALSAVESQQQRLTLQRLVAMVEADKSFHLRVAAILDEVESEMVFEKQRNESAPPPPPAAHIGSDKASYFLAEALHAFDAASMKELSLAVGDYIVVRQVTSSGWAEGECKGRAGWFPSAYVEKRHDVPTNKVVPQVF